MQQTFKRTPIIKMLIGEIKETTVDLPKKSDADQYEPHIYLSPTGAEVSKVFTMGVLVDKEDISAEGDSMPFWRARITDRTGSVYIIAGQYQPEAAAAIAQLDIPSFIVVVGKLNLYQPEEGGKLVSIRAESVVPADIRVQEIFYKDCIDTITARIKSLIPEARTKLAQAYPNKKPEDLLDALNIVTKPER